jgi:hypothetical protein
MPRSSIPAEFPPLYAGYPPKTLPVVHRPHHALLQFFVRNAEILQHLCKALVNFRCLKAAETGGSMEYLFLLKRPHVFDNFGI